MRATVVEHRKRVSAALREVWNLNEANEFKYTRDTCPENAFDITDRGLSMMVSRANMGDNSDTFLMVTALPLDGEVLRAAMTDAFLSGKCGDMLESAALERGKEKSSPRPKAFVFMQHVTQELMPETLLVETNHWIAEDKLPIWTYMDVGDQIEIGVC